MAVKKIVVVDDDESIRKTFFLILHKNYRVYLAKDAREALERFRVTSVDLIIADIKLPRMNGLEMIERFRELGYKGEVILISAHPDMVGDEELKRFSIAHFFIKPLDLNAFNRSINALLKPVETSEKRL